MQRINIILACFFIPATIGSTNCSAQISESHGQYPFVHYTPQDGLVSSRVRKAYQDSKGRMYFLTYGGLSVFDGARFKNYTTQNGLATNVVNDILEVGDDSFLLATNSGYYLNVLVKGKIGRLKTEGETCPVVNQFYRHEDNRIFLSGDDGLFVLENRKIRKLDISPLTQNGTEPYLGNITGSGNYLVIATTDIRFLKGLYLYDIKNNAVCAKMPGAEIFVLGKDSCSRVWIYMWDKLFILDSIALASGRLSLIPPTIGSLKLSDYRTATVSFDKRRLWLMFRNKNDKSLEVHRIDATGALFRMTLPEQAASSEIQSIFVDSENNVWLLSDGEGVFKIAVSPLLIFAKPFNTQAHLDRAFYFNNVTWFNDHSNKLLRSSRERIEEFSCNLKKAPAVFYGDGKRLLAYDHSNIYEGEINQPKKRIDFRVLVTIAKPDFFGLHMLADPNGNVLTEGKSGLSVWSKNRLIFHLPIAENDNIDELALDKKKLLWVVKRSTGISVFSLHPENLSEYLQPVYHFAADHITGSPRCFMVDQTGLIWIGTREHGLVGYRQEADRLKKLYHFDVGNGLTDNFVTTLACDSSNNIIVGTQTGLDRLLLDSNHSYRLENLSQSSNFFALISQAWADGKQAYALTYAGSLLKLSPTMAPKSNNLPKLLLEELRVNGKPVSKEKNSFQHSENNISVLVAAPSFIDERRVTYSYFLQGSGNKRWSDTTPANAIINLTNLSSAKYLLRVRAFFPSTSYSTVEISYPFEIAPPWWQTWWFRIIALTIMIGLFIIVFRSYYNRKLEKQKAVLEKQQAIEKERTRIATDMHDDLGAGLSRIKFLTQSILNKKIKDDAIKNELEKITSFSDEMSEKMGEIVWALNEKNDTLADLIAYTRSYAVEYLINHGIECDAATPSHLPDTFITGEIRRNIFLSVKECLHNIVKHASATKVCFSVQLDGAMEIVIHDNGKGIDWNNRRAFSNGIENVNRRMKEIHGSVHFAKEQGTKVSLTIPLTL